MRTFRIVLVALLTLPFLLNAQDEGKYRMVELSYMKAKIAMEDKFEAAVKTHNEKYHKEGKYAASLYAVSTGNEAGWYVWAMGPITFTDLDSRPGKGDHIKDWQKNVAPYVADYGRVEYWRWSESLSNWKESDEKMINLWWVDIERGEYYRFKSFMKKVVPIFKDKDDEMNVYNSAFNQGDGRDVAMVWPMENWASMDVEDWNMKEEYDKMYGEGSWDNALEEWEDFVAGMVSEVWREVQ